MKLLLIIIEEEGAELKNAELIGMIKSAENWAHYLRSTWIVMTDREISWWSSKINSYDNIDYFITDITNTTYDGLLSPQAWEWLTKQKEKIKEQPTVNF
jgi:hypothetical protein